eukprot:scaffold98921_cov66-Phaeocystis_antarctica.AAC.2
MVVADPCSVASSQGDVRPSSMAYPAVWSVPKLPLPLRPETRPTSSLPLRRRLATTYVVFTTRYKHHTEHHNPACARPPSVLGRPIRALDHELGQPIRIRRVPRPQASLCAFRLQLELVIRTTAVAVRVARTTDARLAELLRQPFRHCLQDARQRGWWCLCGTEASSSGWLLTRSQQQRCGAAAVTS